MSQAVRRALVVGAILCMTLLVALQSPLSPISNASIDTDPGVFATIAKGMKQGLLPYRDMFDHKGPLLYLLYWMFYAPFGLGGIWLMQCLSALATLAMAYRMLRAFATRGVACLALLVGSIALCYYYNTGGFTEDLALPMLVCGMSLCLRALREERLAKRDGVLLGMCFAGCFLLRANLIGLFVGYGLCTAVAWLIRGRWKELLTYAGCCIGGAAIVCAPFAIGMLSLGMWDDFVRCYWSFNLSYTESSSRTLLSNLLIAARQNRLWLVGGLAAGFAACSLRDGKRRWLDLGTLVAFGCSFLLADIARRGYSHYMSVMIPFYFLIAGQTLQRLWDWLQTPRAWQRAAVLLSLVLILHTDGIDYAAGRIVELAHSEQKAGVETFVQALDDMAEEGDTLAVYGNDCAPYVYSHVAVGARYPYSAPLIALDEEIMRDYVASMGESTFFVLPQGRVIDELPEAVRDKLNELYDLVLVHGRYTLYRRKG